MSLSQSGLFGQPYLHMFPKSGDKLSLDMEMLSWIHHSNVAEGALSPCSRNSKAVANAAVGLFLVNGPYVQSELGHRLIFWWFES